MGGICNRCGGRQSVHRYRLAKPGHPERDLCKPCADGTVAVYGLVLLDATPEELGPPPEVETATEQPTEEPPNDQESGDITVAPAVADEGTNPVPARKPRRRRSKP